MDRDDHFFVRAVCNLPVIRKGICSAGGITMPKDADDKTLGFAFIEYSTPQASFSLTATSYISIRKSTSRLWIKL